MFFCLRRLVYRQYKLDPGYCTGQRLKTITIYLEKNRQRSESSNWSRMKRGFLTCWLRKMSYTIVHVGSTEPSSSHRAALMDQPTVKRRKPRHTGPSRVRSTYPRAATMTFRVSAPPSSSTKAGVGPYCRENKPMSSSAARKLVSRRSSSAWLRRPRS